MAASSNTQTKLLITGVTGFIGGSVLSTIITSQDPQVQACKVSVVLRDAAKAHLYEQKGLNVVLIKDLDDLDTLKQAAREHDVVINCFTGFATSTARALIQGLGERKRETGQQPSYIQTSGTSNLGDFPISKRYVEQRYPDKAFQDTEDIDAHQRHRESLQEYPQRTSDVVVIDTGAAEGVTTYIMMPPTIWGKGSGYVHRRSMQVPAMCRGALKAKQAVVIGEGKGVMDHVHVLDLAMLYELVLQSVLRGDNIPSGREGIYFCETGHHTWNELGAGIGKAGRELGYLDTAAVKYVDLKEGADYLAGNVLQPEHIEAGFALNSITQTTKAKSLGWEPRFTREDFLGSFRDELEVAHGDHE